MILTIQLFEALADQHGGACKPGIGTRVFKWSENFPFTHCMYNGTECIVALGPLYIVPAFSYFHVFDFFVVVVLKIAERDVFDFFFLS